MAAPALHFFRTMTKHHISSLALTIDYPVTGVILVPDGAADPHSHIEQRMPRAAARCMEAIASTGSQAYTRMAAAMTLVAPVRASMRIDPKMPPSGLRHTSPATACEACRAAVQCNPKTSDHRLLRSSLERMISRVPKEQSETLPAFYGRVEVLINSQIIF